jgi:DNA gyrase inhibitor GyrI
MKVGRYCMPVFLDVSQTLVKIWKDHFTKLKTASRLLPSQNVIYYTELLNYIELNISK